MPKIVIIGASSGVGARLAHDFARIGFGVGAAARREEPLRELRDKYPDRVQYTTLDVTSQDATRRFYDLIERLGGMDYFVYCAGCGWDNPQLDETMDVRTVDVNVGGFTRLVSAAYAYYKQTANDAPGHIAAITSVGGVKGLGQCAAYCASKRYQWTFLQALDQLAHTQHVNVRITDIRPGFMDTALLGADTAERYPLLMSLDYACPRIERAILRAPRVAYIDSRWRAVSALWSLIPNALWPHLSFRF